MVIFYGPEEAPEAKELGQKSPEPIMRLEATSVFPQRGSDDAGQRR